MHVFTFAESDPYCFIKCEGQTARSHSVTNTLNPVWEFTAILYRKDPSKSIKIQIWNSNVVFDSFMGQAFLLAPPEPDHDPTRSKTTVHVLGLVGKKKSRQSETIPGELKVEFETYEDVVKI